MSSSEHILLATDIPDHASSYHAALRNEGFSVHVTSTGGDALTFAERHVPDCVVIDLRLPDFSGWELCKKLRARPRLKDTPMIILTPDISATHAIEGSTVGCHAWLARPAFARDLVKVVRHVLNQNGPAPRTPEEAVLNEINCPACESTLIRAGLRMAFIQYYTCRACRFHWRVEAA